MQASYEATAAHLAKTVPISVSHAGVGLYADTLYTPTAGRRVLLYVLDVVIVGGGAVSARFGFATAFVNINGAAFAPGRHVFSNGSNPFCVGDAINSALTVQGGRSADLTINGYAVIAESAQ